MRVWLESNKCLLWKSFGKDEEMMKRQLLARLSGGLCTCEHVESMGSGDWCFARVQSCRTGTWVFLDRAHSTKCYKLYEENKKMSTFAK